MTGSFIKPLVVLLCHPLAKQEVAMNRTSIPSAENDALRRPTGQAVVWPQFAIAFDYWQA